MGNNKIKPFPSKKLVDKCHLVALACVEHCVHLRDSRMTNAVYHVVTFIPGFTSHLNTVDFSRLSGNTSIETHHD